MKEEKGVLSIIFGSELAYEVDCRAYKRKLGFSLKSANEHFRINFRGIGQQECINCLGYAW